MLLFGLCDVSDSLAVAEMLNALAADMFRAEVGFGLPGMSNGHCPANWHNFRRSQRVLGVRREKSGFSLLGPHQFSACAGCPSCWGAALVELQAPTRGQAPVPCFTSDVCSAAST